MKLIPLDQLPSISRLTSRELEVYDLLGYGMSRRSISTELGISPHTLKNHLETIKTKLGVEHVSDVTRAAVCTAIHAGPAKAPSTRARHARPQRTPSPSPTASTPPDKKSTPTEYRIARELPWRPAPFLSILLAPWAA